MIDWSAFERPEMIFCCIILMLLISPVPVMVIAWLIYKFDERKDGDKNE